MSNELKPCPFCGGVAVAVSISTVGCEPCGIYTSPQRWASRAESADLAAARAEIERLRGAMKGIKEAETTSAEYVVKLWIPFFDWRAFRAALDATPAPGREAARPE